MYKKYPQKYKKFLKLVETEEFKENFKCAFFRTKLSVKIREARKKQNLTQKELKSKVGTTQRIISEIENGNYNMEIDLLYKIFNVLKIKLKVDDEDLI